jgi:hypothetical protein
MIPYMLLAAAALAILVATAVELREEAERIRMPVRRARHGGFDAR